MNRPVPLMSLLMLIALVAALHLAGFYFQFYWRITWYDHVVHTLGGLWVGLMAAFYCYSRFSFKRPALFVIALLSAILIGIAWEVFEVKAGITVLADHGYAADTIGDIISDTLGGLLAGAYVLTSSRFKQAE
jgi:hypothetical protein